MTSQGCVSQVTDFSAQFHYSDSWESFPGLDTLTLTIQITEIPHADLRARLEALIRECIGARPEWEEWNVSLEGPRLGALGYCWLAVQSPGQKRQRVFYEQGDRLVEDIRAWFKLYPFR